MPKNRYEINSIYPKLFNILFNLEEKRKKKDDRAL